LRFLSPFLLLLFLQLTTSLPSGAEPFERRVLGLYNSAEGKTLEFNNLRQEVEAIFHYLGLHLDYHDIAEPLPGPGEMASYRGVVIWLETDKINAVDEYWSWLDAQLRAGRRLLLLNDIGPIFDATTGQRIPLSRINRVLALMGLRAGENYTSLPLDIELIDKVPEVVEFERKLIYELARFREIRSTSPRNQVFLQLRMKSTGALADAVVLTPNGGFIGESYARYMDPENFKRQWRIDPFYFFSRALGVEDSPRPDCTTLNGNRIYYSHIDGDGLINLSLVDQKSASGQIILDEILAAYPQLPFTVSVIVTEVEPATIGSRESMELGRNLFRLDNVEPASHTYSHPLIWNTDLTDEYEISQYLYEIDYARMSGKALLAWPLEDYEYSPEKETVWTCRYIEENLLPPDKQCRLLLWSGNCLPDEETLALLAQSGLQNMNGGDSRFDGDFPSYSTVAPLYRQVGPYYQIHSSNSNENVYTALWSGPYGGFQNVLQTFRNSENPRRILPINVYYHFYSGERQAALLALQRVYEWVLAQREEIFPVYASRFVDVVHGFISTRIEQLGERLWRITDNGQCRTVRFDACALYPDLNRTTGVLGFRHYQNCLYVSLDESQEHLIPLTEQPPARPYLTQATADVLELTADRNGGLRFRSEALGEATFIWANLVPNTDYAVRVEGKSDETVLTPRTDAVGILHFTAPLRGGADISISPAATGGGSG
jgi:polysaccharide biosynthesis protein PelA